MRGFGLTIPRIMALLEAAKARRDDHMKAQSLGFGLAMAGKKGAKALDKLFPGKGRAPAELVSAEENPLGIAAEALADEAIEYQEGEQDEFLDAVKQHFGPHDD